jgi:hypothetical protein
MRKGLATIGFAQVCACRLSAHLVIGSVARTCTRRPAARSLSDARAVGVGSQQTQRWRVAARSPARGHLAPAANNHSRTTSLPLAGAPAVRPASLTAELLPPSRDLARAAASSHRTRRAPPALAPALPTPPPMPPGAKTTHPAHGAHAAHSARACRLRRHRVKERSSTRNARRQRGRLPAIRRIAGAARGLRLATQPPSGADDATATRRPRASRRRSPSCQRPGRS